MGIYLEMHTKHDFPMHFSDEIIFTSFSLYL